MSTQKKRTAGSRVGKPVKRLGKKSMKSEKGGIIAVLIGARANQPTAPIVAGPSLVPAVQ